MSSPRQAISKQYQSPQENGANAAQPAHEDIAQLAYHLWERRMLNDADGSPEQDWLESEQQLQAVADQAET